MSRTKPAPFDPTYPRPRKDVPATTALRERIAADLEAFRARGGHIEVLAITRPRDRRDDAE